MRLNKLIEGQSFVFKNKIYRVLSFSYDIMNEDFVEKIYVVVDDDGNRFRFNGLVLIKIWYG